ncbi:MFS transporter [Mesotoga prima]|uniref:MFS transporter n=1 Tax=Mesotoga prima TaxID=1184387 RepID=UPI002FDB5849
MDDYLGYNKHEYRRTRKLAIIEGSFFNLAFLVTQGFIVTGLALEYGASEMLIAIIGVLPTLAQLVQLAAPLVLKLFKDRKKAMLFSALLGRIPIAFIPVTLALGIRAQSMLLVLLGLIAFGNSLVGTFWASIMGDVIDPATTGKYYGRRNLILSLSTMLITPVYSLILDRYEGSLGFIIVTSMATAFAITTIFLLKMHYAPPVKTFGRGRMFKEVFSNLKFRQYLKFAFVWNFAITISGPFYAYHQLVNLKVSYSYLSILSIVASLTSMLMYVLWGKISDQIGHQSVAEFGILGATCLALMWVFVTPQTAVFLLPVDAIVTGVVWSAINLCLFTMMMGMIRGYSVESYVAVQAFLNGIGALGGSLLGGFIASYLKGKSITIFGMEFFGIQVIFLVGASFRFLSFLLLRRVQTPKIKTVTQVFFNTMSTIGRRMATRPYEFPVLQLRSRKKREEAEPLKLDLPTSMIDLSDIEGIEPEETTDDSDHEERSDS